MYHQSIKKINGWKLVRIASFTWILQLTTLIPTALAQSNCEKYCFESCHKYFPGPEFGSCVGAHINCNCLTSSQSTFHTTPPTRHKGLINGGNNGVIITISFILFVIVATCVCIGCSYRFITYISASRNNVVAQPIVSTVSSSQNNRSSHNHRSTTRGYHNNIVASPVRPSAPAPTPNPGNEIPPEYVPPPPYNDCVIIMEEKPQNRGTT